MVAYSQELGQYILTQNELKEFFIYATREMHNFSGDFNAAFSVLSSQYLLVKTFNLPALQE